MAEPQLSIRSEKARTIAYDLAAKEDRPIARIIEEALEEYRDRRLEAEKVEKERKVAALLALIDEQHRCMNGDVGRGSDLSDFYDEDGLPV